MILMPATLDDWKHQLSQPKTPPRSHVPAQLTERWRSGSGFPVEIASLLSTTEATRRAAVLVVVPNHRVPLAGGAHASDLDLWVLARTARGLLSVAIDCIGEEAFDVEARNRPATTTSERLWRGLRHLLEIDESANVPVSCQLVHRTTAALVEAKRFFARSAAVIVHSFSQGIEGFSDFQRFVHLMGGARVEPGRLVEVRPREGIELVFGWAQAPSVGASPSGA